MLIAWSVKCIAVYDNTPAQYITPELKCFIYWGEPEWAPH